MASINTILPQELLLRILEVGALRSNSRTLRARYNLLTRTSLVSRYWSGLSRFLLWRKLHVGTERQAQMLMDSPAWGQYHTVLMTIYGESYEGGVKADSVWEVLSGVSGLEELSIDGYSDAAGLDFAALCSHNLEGLKSLRLTNTILGFSFPPYIAPSALTDLSLDLYNTFSTPASETCVRDILELVASQVTILDIHNFTSSLLPTFSLCTSLTSLRISCSCEDLAYIIRVAPSQFTSLAINLLLLHPPASLHGLVEVLEERSLAKMARLEFSTHDRGYVDRVPGGHQLLSALEERGVKIVFSRRQ